jgi:omega-amidase
VEAVPEYREQLRNEHRHLISGDHVTLCPTSWGPVGLAICYDLRFPELFRVMALAGADLFLVPVQLPVPRLDAWLTLARARAVENALFVAVCNRVGSEGEVTFAGQSLVVDPLGRVLVEGDDQERLLIARANLREIHKARRYLAIYEDRRPGAYKALCFGLPADGDNREKGKGPVYVSGDTGVDLRETDVGTQDRVLRSWDRFPTTTS